MDIIDVSPDDLVLPGDCLGGAVLEGWAGPALWINGDDEIMRRHACRGVLLGESYRGRPALCDTSSADYFDWDISGIAVKILRFDCRRSEVRDRLRRVLAAGKRCVACDGEGKSGPKMSAFKWTDDGMVRCSACNGTGYTRPPHDLGHFIDAEIAGRITPLVAAGLWWCSALRVEAGMGPVVGWDDLYQNNTDACSVERWCNARTWWTHGPEQRDYFTAPSGTGHLGWEWGTNRGMETGEAAAACLNRAALSAGFALLNDDHILLPLPDRIARLRLEG